MKERKRAFQTDKHANRLVETAAESTQDDLLDLRSRQFEFERKGGRVNMRLPVPLLDAVKKIARARGIPYQRFIRETLEGAIARRGER